MSAAQQRSPDGGVASAVLCLIRQIRTTVVERMRQRRERRARRDALRALSHRELADIGLVRADVATVGLGVVPPEKRRAPPVVRTGGFARAA